MRTHRKNLFPTIPRHRLILARLAAVFIYGLMFTFPMPLIAGEFTQKEHTDSADTIRPPSASTTTTSSDVLRLLKGQSAGDSLYLGMWSQHFINDDDSYRHQHHLIGVCWQGFFLGTFLNSHGDRSWAGGWQRDIHAYQHGDLSLQTGYRIGLMYGYDELSLGGSKVFPLLQVYSDISYRDVGIQFSWAGSVVLAGFFIRF